MGRELLVGETSKAATLQHTRSEKRYVPYVRTYTTSEDMENSYKIQTIDNCTVVIKRDYVPQTVATRIHWETHTVCMHAPAI